MIEIMVGNSLELLEQFEDASFDCILTDPPYEETALGWDRWPEGWPSAVRRLLKPTGSMWVFGSQRMFFNRAAEFHGWHMVQDVVWEKHKGSGLRRDRFRRIHELALHFYRTDTRWCDVYKCAQYTHDAVARKVRRTSKPAHWSQIGDNDYQSVEGGPRMMTSVIYSRSEHGRAQHPTQKPMAIVEPLLRYSCPPGGRVLDLFAGSGTTGVAAQRHGIDAVLIEARAEYAEIIRSRLADDAPLFEGAA